MDEAPYQNRELREMFSDIKEQLNRVEVQTTHHNGRMTKIEKRQERATGAMAVIVAVVIPILGWALYTLANINDTVHRSVDEALSAYNIQK